MMPTPYIVLLCYAIEDKWILDDEAVPAWARCEESLAAWLAESCDREWLN